MNSLRVGNFMNKAYIRVIYIRYVSILQPQSLDKMANNNTNNFPSTLIESHMKTVRPKGLPHSHIKKLLLNLNIVNVILKISSMMLIHVR